MKVTIYELLGMVKDGKAPKKIRYIDKIFTSDELHADYVFMETYGESNTREYLTDWIGLSKDGLTDEVEILEEEKKIPEKLEKNHIIGGVVDNQTYYEEKYNTEDIGEKVNEIIDYLDYLKSKGE